MSLLYNLPESVRHVAQSGTTTSKYAEGARIVYGLTMEIHLEPRADGLLADITLTAEELKSLGSGGRLTFTLDKPQNVPSVVEQQQAVDGSTRLTRAEFHIVRADGPSHP
jgi:hypothetical protein